MESMEALTNEECGSMWLDIISQLCVEQNLYGPTAATATTLSSAPALSSLSSSQAKISQNAPAAVRLPSFRHMVMFTFTLTSPTLARNYLYAHNQELKIGNYRKLPHLHNKAFPVCMHTCIFSDTPEQTRIDARAQDAREFESMRDKWELARKEQW
jgi:hypothetical protein